MARPKGPQAIHLLFICSANKLRSPTAEYLYHNFPGYVAKSAGTDRSAGQRVSAGMLGWADLIFVMEPSHRSYLRRKFRDSILGKRVVCLHFPDEYAYNDPELIELLKMNLSPHIAVPE